MNATRVSLRLALAFGALIVVLLVVGWLGLSRMAGMNAEIQEIADRRWHKVRLSRQALSLSALNSRLTMQIFLLDDRREIDALLEQRARHTAAISTLLREIESKIESEQERTLLFEVWTNRVPYVESYQRALGLLAEESHRDEGRRMMAQAVLPKLIAYHQAYENFVEFQGQQMDHAADLAEVHYRSARQQVVVLLVLAALLAGGLAVFVTRAVAEQINQRLAAERALLETRGALEVRVEQRTAELTKANEQLLEISRMAGMAEVATSALHNIGNVLTSANLAVSLVADRMRRSCATDLPRVVALLREHTGDLGGFLSQDPKGRKVPAFLHELAERLSKERQGQIEELRSLGQHIDHIKEIVVTQQNYARVSGTAETVRVSDLVEDALRMNGAGLSRREIRVIREYGVLPPISVEKHKVLQILLNLVRNAQNACEESAAGQRTLTLRLALAAPGTAVCLPMCTISDGEVAPTKEAWRTAPTTAPQAPGPEITSLGPGGAERIQITVIDNGVGIHPANLSRIFCHGFTTKKNGHGFGLHSGALVARELGGRLSVHSDGPGLGAAFTLELPVRAPSSDLSPFDEAEAKAA